jgi:hypothetical protein
MPAADLHHGLEEEPNRLVDDLAPAESELGCELAEGGTAAVRESRFDAHGEILPSNMREITGVVKPLALVPTDPCD